MNEYEAAEEEVALARARLIQAIRMESRAKAYLTEQREAVLAAADTVAAKELVAERIQAREVPALLGVVEG